MKTLSISSLKSHDYHVIMMYLLPVLLQHAFPRHKELRTTLHQISLYFRILCSKVLCKSDLEKARFMVAEAMCMLEKYFPASFFDICIHNMVHLADKALICGPVRFQWMYPFERAMKDCKNIPNNKRFIEGSISVSRLLQESVMGAMECMPNANDGNHKATWEAFLRPDAEFSDVGSMLKDKKVTLTNVQFVQIHREFCDTLLPILDSTGKEVTVDEVETQTKFIPWLVEKLVKEKKTDSVLWRLAQGPVGATEYIKYRVNCFVFSPRSYEEDRDTQDSGVCVEA
ncbi:uncharacterized protein LOC113279134 isoform X3 [Papaver somniferum]|uniref:uncharacterized protein LOC113279134 isoform X3 n=1 Tax=Papaver somniferum TaxID=3469 RepID=UPI000E705CC2|nr:uncharacterized protein LOC113279134 isoform X3 [Papaver somniferum]